MGLSDLATLVPQTSADAVLAMSTGGFIPRLQVCGGSSDAVKNEKIPVNMFGIIYDKDAVENMGKEVNLVLISYRVKALDMSQKTASKIFSYYDPASDAFQEVQKRSFIQDSNCSFGPEFHTWLPTAKQGVGTFATFFLGSKTSRREGPSVMGLMGNSQSGYAPAPATLKIKIIKGDKHTWAGFDALPCSQPMEDVLPTPEEFTKQTRDFANPVSSVIVAAPQSAGPQRER